MCGFPLVLLHPLLVRHRAGNDLQPMVEHPLLSLVYSLQLHSVPTFPLNRASWCPLRRKACSGSQCPNHDHV
ncbi:hypothetical protein BJX96DRAFT_141754 [Aspergillus floccosus]